MIRLERAVEEIAQRDEELDSLRKKYSDVNSKLSLLQAEADHALSEQKKAVDKLNKVLAELEDARREIDNLRQGLNDSDMQRVAAESKLQSALDKIELEKRVRTAMCFFLFFPFSFPLYPYFSALSSFFLLESPQFMDHVFRSMLELTVGTKLQNLVYNF